MNTKTHTHHNGHGHGLLTLDGERTALLDPELELSYGPGGLTAREVPNAFGLDELVGEPIGVRVSLHPFLAGMSHHHLMLLTDCAETEHFRKGEIILKEGDHADRFYLIENGRVALEATTENDNHVLVDTISGGDLLGWSWMVPPHIWHFTARAVEATDAIYFSGPALHEYCDEVHSLGYELFKRMSAVMMRRLQAARTRMLDVRAVGCRDRDQ